MFARVQFATSCFAFNLEILKSESMVLTLGLTGGRRSNFARSSKNMKRLLLVDDHQDSLAVLTLMLSDRYVVRGCECAVEALAELECRPTDVLRPFGPVWDRLAQRIATDSGTPPVQQTVQVPVRPEWEKVAPGISVMLLATDDPRDRVSMLVGLRRERIIRLIATPEWRNCINCICSMAN
jgi:hypothetical protein